MAQLKNHAFVHGAMNMERSLFLRHNFWREKPFERNVLEEQKSDI